MLRHKGRVLIVPDQWSGSVQQYYHFLLGYLAPTLSWCATRRSPKITVRDSGPMNRWFEFVSPLVDVEVISVGDALHVFAGKRQRSIVLKGFDYPDSFSRKKLAHFRRTMLEITTVGPSASSPIVAISDRIQSDAFFHSSGAEVPLSGAERRSVPNLYEAAEGLCLGESIMVFDPSDMSPPEQIEAHANVRVLVGQHGAGLTNMVWMKPGGVIIEIHPPLPAEAIHTFRKLAEACGHHYVTIPQSSVHSPIEPQLFADTVMRHVRTYL